MCLNGNELSDSYLAYICKLIVIPGCIMQMYSIGAMNRICQKVPKDYFSISLSYLPYTTIDTKKFR